MYFKFQESASLRKWQRVNEWGTWGRPICRRPSLLGSGYHATLGWGRLHWINYYHLSPIWLQFGPSHLCISQPLQDFGRSIIWEKKKCFRKLGDQIIILITFPWINILSKFARMRQTRSTRIICIQMSIFLGSWFYFYVTTTNREFQPSTPPLFPSKEKAKENEKMKQFLGIQRTPQTSVH